MIARRAARSSTVLIAVATALAAALYARSDNVSPASRNRAVAVSGLPTDWSVEERRNLLWSAELGTETYGGPTLAGELVVVGTNNERPRDPGITGDRGVVVAFERATGAFRWQVTHAKLESGADHDWPLQGVCSTPTYHHGALYYVSNRGELVIVDLAGRVRFALDMVARLGTRPRHMSVSSPVVAGERVYTLTSNGVGDSGRVPAPTAPSFLAASSASGEVVWSSALPGDRLIEGQWSSPTWAVVAGRPQVLFPAGDGWLYALDPQNGSVLWKFDGNAVLPAETPVEARHAFLASAVIWRDRAYIGVGRDPEASSAAGHLFAIDATRSGDVSGSGVVWHFQHRDFGRTLSTVAIADGLLYTADLNGFVFCLDAETGELLWQHDNFAAIWSSPLLADGKVYVADTEGDVTIYRASRKLEVLAEIAMAEPIYASPVAADGVLYVATQRHLYALAERPGGGRR